jgi:hypothetical protein
VYALLDDHADVAAGNALHDLLTEYEDPRLDLWRLPDVIDTQAGKVLEPGPDVRVSIDHLQSTYSLSSSKITTSRRHWEEVRLIHEAGNARCSGRRRPWRGVHGLGRLFSYALINRAWGVVNGEAGRWMTACRLNSARLIGHKLRNAQTIGRLTAKHLKTAIALSGHGYDQNGYYWPRAMAALPSSSFGVYVYVSSLCETGMSWDTRTKMPHECVGAHCLTCLRVEAVIRTNVLNMFSVFKKCCPWKAARDSGGLPYVEF